MNVKVKRLNEAAVIPQYAHKGDSGFDLVATEDVIVEPGETVKVPTGLAFEIPAGYELQVRPRSGITSKTKLRVQLGTVDAGYRGEVSVMVDNIFDRDEEDRHDIYAEVISVAGDLEMISMCKPYGTYIIRKGDRIAQGVIAPVVHAQFDEVETLGDSARGAGGFGSSGVSAALAHTDALAKLSGFVCTGCDIKFDAKFKEDGFLPDCPECGIDYRVFQIKEDK